MIVQYKGVEIEVEYDYQPEEAMVRYYSDGSGYPGCPEQIDITDIKIGDQDANELFENDLEAIEEIMYEQRNEENH